MCSHRNLSLLVVAWMGTFFAELAVSLIFHFISGNQGPVYAGFHALFVMDKDLLDVKMCGPSTKSCLAL